MEKTIRFLSAITFYRTIFFATFCATPLQAYASLWDGDLSDPSSIYHTLKKDHPFVIEAGIEYLHTAIPTIQNVIVENPSTSATNSNTYGNVDNSYPDVLAQTIRAQFLLSDTSKWTLSIKTFLPLNSLAQMDTGNTYQPEFVLYRAELQRPRIAVMSGMNLSDDWRVGLGADVGFSIDAVADVYLQSGTGTYSDQRISAKLKPNVASQASLQYLDYSFTARGENKSTLDLSANATAAVFSAVKAGLDFSYLSQSALYFEPWEFELDGKVHLTETTAILWGASYEMWSRFQAPAAIIQGPVQNNCNGQSGCNSSFSPGLTPAFQARDLIVPTLGIQWQMADNRYQFTYRFKDSIFKNTPTSNGNYLDPPRHDAMFQVTFPFASGFEWSLHAQVSRLMSQDVVKSDVNEIGAPGYTASGWLYGGGVDVSIPLKE